MRKLTKEEQELSRDLDEYERQCGRRAAEEWATRPGRTMADIKAVAQYKEDCAYDQPTTDETMEQLNAAWGCPKGNNNIPIGYEFDKKGGGRQSGEYSDAWYATICEIARETRQ